MLKKVKWQNWDARNNNGLEPGISYSSKAWVCFLYLYVFELRNHPHANRFLMKHENINFIK